MRKPRGCVYWSKARKSWIAQLDWVDEDTGKPRQRKRQVESKTGGQDLCRKWIQELKETGTEYLDAERVTFKQLADEYEKVRLIPPVYRNEKKVKGLRDWEDQRRRLHQLVEYFGAKRVQRITYNDIEKYRNMRLDTPVETKKRDGTVVDSRERSIGDVNRVLSLLRTALNYAIEKEWLKINPFKKGKGLIDKALEVPRDRVLSIAEQRRLLQACQVKTRRHIFPLVLTALDSGARANELLTLKWDNIDLEAGIVRITSLNAKTNKARDIDLEAVTIAELRKLAAESGALPDQTLFGIKAFGKAWKAALKEAGITGCRFHDTRASAITHWLLRGMRMEFAMKRSGHSDPRTFMKYVRLAESIRESVREQMREWELATSLAELAREQGIEEQLERPELIN